MNYSKLTDQELDKLAAETFGDEIITCEFSKQPFVRFGIYDYNIEHNEDMEVEWCPTDPDSNQVERYLFPKLRDRLRMKCGESISIRQMERDDVYTITISPHKNRCT